MYELNRNAREIRFQGSFAGLDQIRFVASIAYDEFDPTVLDVTLVWLGGEESHQAGAQALRFPRRELVLHAEDPSFPDVEVLGIGGITTGGNEATIRANAIRVGVTRHKYSEDRAYLFKAELQPSGILSLPMIRNMSYTGEIKHEHVLAGTVEVNTPFGMLEACERYEHYSSQESGNKTTHSVQRAAITGTLALPTGKTLSELHDQLQKDLNDMLLSLSFCYRQPVGCYEIRYIPVPGPEIKDREFDSFERIKWNSSRSKTREDELINTRALIAGGLERLTSSIRTNPERESLERAIRFLTASYVAHLEPAFFMAFSAMEATVDACIPNESRYLARASEWKTIERELRQILDSLHLGTVGDLMKLKLPELRRTSLLSRVQDACKRMGPPVSDLWPGLDFASGMASAAKIRNDLFHSARIHDDLTEMSRNLIRIRTFTERLLLKRLGWPDDQIWHWYDQNLKWANA